MAVSFPDSDFYSVETSGLVATIWLDRPEKLNAIDEAGWRDLPEIMRTAADADDVRVVVIAARGRSFTAGIDLRAMAPLLSAAGSAGVAPRRALHRKVREMQETFTSIAACPKPVIAAVHGHCLGAGIDLISACDIRLASADAVFSVRETRMAMVADVGTIQRLPRIISPAAATEMILTGGDYDAQSALRMGLVGRVFDDAAALHAGAAGLAGEIARNSPLAVTGAKAMLAANEGRTVGQALDAAALWSAAYLHSRDLEEAVGAYLERREPDFKGE